MRIVGVMFLLVLVVGLSVGWRSASVSSASTVPIPVRPPPSPVVSPSRPSPVVSPSIDAGAVADQALSYLLERRREAVPEANRYLQLQGWKDPRAVDMGLVKYLML